MRRPPVVDIALAAAFACLGLADTFAELSPPSGSAPARTALVPVLVVAAALAWRRTSPLAAVVAVVAAVALPGAAAHVRLVYWGEFVPWLVALYSLGRHALRRRAAAGLIVSVVGFAALCVRYPDLRDPGNALYDVGLMVIAVAVGAVVRQRAGLREENLRLELDRRLAAERATSAERSRIARELHDVISHGISVIVLQAGGARLKLDRDPEAVRDALRRIEHAGRESLAELRVMLQVLRSDELPDVGGSGDGSTQPLPTLSRLGDLVAEHRDLGLPVRLEAPDELAELPLPIQLSAYRVVQEGLTNVRKHAGPTATTVALRLTDVLAVEVTNERGTHRAATGSGGFGLLGLEERVAVLGGRLQAGCTPEGGYRLHAEIPLRMEAA